jgi:hypothetical protein
MATRTSRLREAQQASVVLPITLTKGSEILFPLRSDLDEGTAAPCEGRTSVTCEDQVGSEAGMTTIPVREWMDLRRVGGETAQQAPATESSNLRSRT